MLIESIICSDGWKSYNCPANIEYNKYFQADRSENKFAGGTICGGHLACGKFGELNKIDFNPHLEECVFGFNNRNRDLY